jgi:hypothetical protein
MCAVGALHVLYGVVGAHLSSYDTSTPVLVGTEVAAI